MHYLLAEYTWVVSSVLYCCHTNLKSVWARADSFLVASIFFKESPLGKNRAPCVWCVNTPSFCKSKIWKAAPHQTHDDVIKWKHFLRYWPFVRGIHRFPVNSPHKGQWRGALMFSLVCARINGWVNDGEAGDLRRHRAHYDVIVMKCDCPVKSLQPDKMVCSELLWYQ